MQAVRAVVTVPPAGDGRADELPALAAPERLVPLGARRPSCSPWRWRPGRGLRDASLATGAVIEFEIVSGQVLAGIEIEGVRNQWCILCARGGGRALSEDGWFGMPATQWSMSRRFAQGRLWIAWFTSGSFPEQISGRLDTAGPTSGQRVPWPVLTVPIQVPVVGASGVEMSSRLGLDASRRAGSGGSDQGTLNQNGLSGKFTGYGPKRSLLHAFLHKAVCNGTLE